MKSRNNVKAFAISAVTLFAISFQAPVVMAQEVQEIKKVRLRVTCNTDPHNPNTSVKGRLTNFTWTRGGNPLRIVNKVPVRCDKASTDTETAAAAVQVPPRANGFNYRVVAVDPNGLLNAAGEIVAARTVCSGEVNFNRSPGDLTERGDPARYVVQCHLGNSDRVVFRVVPFISEVAIVE